MRRHRRRRRKPKASNMDRVSSCTHALWHFACWVLFQMVWSMRLTFVCFFSLHRSAALQTPPCLWTSSLSLSTWVRYRTRPLCHVNKRFNIYTWSFSHFWSTCHLSTPQKSTTSWASASWVRAMREEMEEFTLAPSWREGPWLQMDASSLETCCCRYISGSPGVFYWDFSVYCGFGSVM